MNKRQIGASITIFGGTVLAGLSLFVRDDLSDGGRLILNDRTEFLTILTMAIGVFLIILGFIECYRKELHDLLGVREGRRYCPGCGHRINAGGQYCESCGRRLE